MTVTPQLTWSDYYSHYLSDGIATAAQVVERDYVFWFEILVKVDTEWKERRFALDKRTGLCGFLPEATQPFHITSCVTENQAGDRFLSFYNIEAAAIFHEMLHFIRQDDLSEALKKIQSPIIEGEHL